MLKTFGEYVNRRLREDGESPLGLGPDDLGIKPKGDGPLDYDQEADHARLAQLAKTAAQKYPDDVIAFLEKIAEKDGEIRSHLEALRGYSGRGRSKYRDIGLGNMSGSDDEERDRVLPPFADMNGGESGGLQ